MAGTIYGDDQKTPMASVVVRLVNVANGKEYFARPSGADGTFSLVGIEEGRYAIKIHSNGQEYESGTKLSLKSESTARMDLLFRSKGASGMVSPAMENKTSSFAFNCFKPPMPPKPPRGCNHQGPLGDWDWNWIWGWLW